MCKWRVWYGFNPDPIAATAYPDQSALNALGVVGGLYDDGVSVCFHDPGMLTDDDWSAFVANNLPPVNTLNAQTLPQTLGGSWGCSYAWDLN
jgi:hypothetical protein